MTTEKIRIEIIGGTQQIIDLIESIKGSQIVVSNNCGGMTGEEAIASAMHSSAAIAKTDPGRDEAIDPENWKVGDIVQLSGADGGDSKYWSAGKYYEVTEKSAHGTIFLSSDGAWPIEVSMGIARRWFRLARNAEKVVEQGKAEDRKQHKRSLRGGIRDFFYGSPPTSLRDAGCGIQMTEHDVSGEVIKIVHRQRLHESDDTKVTEKTYGLLSRMLSDERYQVQIDILEETVASLRAELKERKEEGAQLTVVRMDKDMLLGLSLLRPGEAVCFRDRKLTIIME